MQIVNYLIEAYLTFDNDSIENYLKICEDMIDNITDDAEVLFKLKSAVHELVVNSIEHGYEKTSGKVSFSLKRNSNLIELEIKDEGKGIPKSKVNFDFLPDSVEELEARGWGLLILNKLFETIKFSENKPSGTVINMSLHC